MKVLAILGLIALASASPAKYPVIRDLTKYQDRGVLYPHIFEKAGKHPRVNLENKIVGGSEAVPNSYPFIVALFIDDSFFCGGSILNEEWVLTASHCMDGAASVEVVAGAHNVREDEPSQQRQFSTEFTVHEDWVANLVDGTDITVIRLPKALKFNQFVSSIDRAPKDPAVGDLVSAIGWGRPSDSASGISDVLRFVTGLDIISNGDCSSVYGTMSPRIICISANGGAGTCNGDSGGPLVNGKGQLVGLTSFGSSLGCELGFPDGFSSVAQFSDWIDANIQ